MKQLKGILVSVIFSLTLILGPPMMVLASEDHSNDVAGTLNTLATEDVAINETNFPDSTFRAYVQTNIMEDANATILTAEKINETTRINVNYKGIKDLTGIQYFTALKVVRCEGNQLTGLDMRKNTALTDLECKDNKLTSLDMSKKYSIDPFELQL